MPIAELQVYSVERADGAGGVCVVRCVGGVARTGQVYAAGESRVGLRRIERHGRTVGFFDAGHVAKVHLTGAVVALLSRGQVLTSVPPGGHGLQELEDWLAGDPPLVEEPTPVALRVLATQRMQDDRLPAPLRLRWGRVARAACRRKAAWADEEPLLAAAEDAAVRGYLIHHLGPDRADPARDPAGLCRELLDLLTRLGHTPRGTTRRAAAWRELPLDGIRELRRVKTVLVRLESVRPYLVDGDPLGGAVDAWTAVRPRLP
ncbi:hypothetical protein [Streptomyces antimicrobicus]|uniref:Serine/threonine protein kinase n=1 Tax=Streptomyces antimicrobicus TaxID=2883108 RepID=A0ABS8BEL0_9ACTN|nr:hypothetical protein [Streptomyces antimicrobicus]MCB5183074.1 hypothetical protein [Streptomyces antimicrobicus]